jgi:lysophospholipase L1-like esterase
MTILVEVRSSNFRSVVRGLTLLAAVIDEIAFLRDESSAVPDLELGVGAGCRQSASRKNSRPAYCRGGQAARRWCNVRRSMVRSIARAAYLASAALFAVGCERSPTCVLFVGDSLTAFPAKCSLSVQWAARHPEGSVKAWNAGLFGSTAQQWLRESLLPPQLQASSPRIVVIALGTNDIGHHRPLGAIVGDLAALERQAAAFTDARGRHPTVYVATVPPMYDPPDGDLRDWRGTIADVSEVRTRIAALNALIRARFPSDRVIDFDSWMPVEWAADVMSGPADGVHFGCGGQAKRAERVHLALD